MSPKRVKPPHLELKVVVDTNALFTGSSSYFLRKEVADLISQNSSLPDLTIRWIVPEVVRHERQFQMQQVALQMLPTIERLEKLLGHNLNITKEILDARVKETVDRQIQEHGITVQPLNSTDVDWPRLILDASYRRPPFQLGEKEKGFRDALILETFLQIVAASPTSRSAARLALVSGDELLRGATLSRLPSANNVHLLDSVDAVKDLINTIGSAVDEQYIGAIKERAAEVFFKSGDRSSLYYKASVSVVLETTLRNAEVKLPPGADKYTIEKWTISAPRFVKKKHQRMHWTTRFEARLNALKSATPINWSTSGSGLTLFDMPKIGPANMPHYFPGVEEGATEPIEPNNVLATRGYGGSLISVGPSFIGTAPDQTIGHGTASMDASWSLAVTTSGALRKPQLESVDFIEVV